MIFLESIGSRASLSARRQNEARGIRNDASCFFIAIGKLVWRMAIEKQGLPRSGSCREKPPCKCPCVKQKGKASSGATAGSAVANPSRKDIFFSFEASQSGKELAVRSGNEHSKVNPSAKLYLSYIIYIRLKYPLL